jgi:hypothetical protein
MPFDCPVRWGKTRKEKKKETRHKGFEAGYFPIPLTPVNNKK